MGKQEAISKGYTACSKCGGRSSGTITVTYTKKVEVDNTTKNIWGAIAIAVLTTPLAYLFIYALVADYIENKGGPVISMRGCLTLEEKAAGI